MLARVHWCLPLGMRTFIDAWVHFRFQWMKKDLYLC
jgi:hypothetical protein